MSVTPGYSSIPNSLLTTSMAMVTNVFSLLSGRMNKSDEYEQCTVLRNLAAEFRNRVGTHWWRKVRMYQGFGVPLAVVQPIWFKESDSPAKQPKSVQMASCGVSAGRNESAGDMQRQRNSCSGDCFLHRKPQGRTSFCRLLILVVPSRRTKG